MAQVWPDSFVEGNNLAQNISTLRKVLGAGGAKYIETVPKRGYRFVADVKEIRDEASSPVSTEPRPASPKMVEPYSSGLTPTIDLPPPGNAGRGPQAGSPLGVLDILPAGGRSSRQSPNLTLDRPPETMYARSGEVNIAYQVIGEAPIDLVFVMGWVSHLEYFWREPRFARFLMRLASFARLILFDKRGTGL